MSTTDWGVALAIMLVCIPALFMVAVLILALCGAAARGDRQNEAARGQEASGE